MQISRRIFSIILPDVWHERFSSRPFRFPATSCFSFTSPLSSGQGSPWGGGGGWTRGRKMLLFLNESCSLSKTTLSGKGRRGDEVNALCQDWQATEPRAINSERERHFLLVNAILNYYYFIWQKGKAHQGFIAQGVQGIVNGETEGHQNRVGLGDEGALRCHVNLSGGATTRHV